MITGDKIKSEGRLTCMSRYLGITFKMMELINFVAPAARPQVCFQKFMKVALAQSLLGPMDAQERALLLGLHRTFNLPKFRDQLSDP